MPDDPARPSVGRGGPGRPVGRRAAPAAHRDVELPGDPRLARGARDGTDRAASGGRAARERGVLPHPRAQHLGRHPHPGGRRHHPVREPVRGLRVRHLGADGRLTAGPARRPGPAAGDPGADRRPGKRAAHGPRPLVGAQPGRAGRGGGAVQRLPRRAHRGRAGHHPARRHRATAAGARADRAGLPRRADRAAQPDAPAGADRARPAARPPRVVPDLSALRRPGRLQTRQRHARALGGRPPPQRRRAASVRGAAPHRHRGPAGRGRVRRPHGGRTGALGRGSAGRPGHPDADQAFRARRGVGDRVGERRCGHRPRQRGRG